MRKLNAGDYVGAANEIDRWNSTGGVVLGGLVKQRAAERQLFEGV
ncbi:glycoside hydrolase family protein [Dyella tabacisoli]